MSSAALAAIVGAAMLFSYNANKPEPAPEPSPPAPVYEACSASSGGECKLNNTLVYKAGADWGVVGADAPAVFYSASLPAANGEAYVARGICSAEGYTLPTVEQLKWMVDNANVLGDYALKEGLYWADKVTNPSAPLTLSAIAVNGKNGDVVPVVMTQELSVRCVVDIPHADRVETVVDGADVENSSVENAE